MSYPVHRFTAGYPGRCRSCDERFEEGEEVGYVDDELFCQICCDDEDEERGV